MTPPHPKDSFQASLQLPRFPKVWDLAFISPPKSSRQAQTVFIVGSESKLHKAVYESLRSLQNLALGPTTARDTNPA